MRIRHFIIATAGHVDHGKSSLVRALTGVDPDRLPEEKARGITIDLGFASLVLPAADGESNLGIIDVPGHEDFVRNMVAGVGAVDVALLTVAADDGWMPQTEEHLQILAGLGVTRMVVALTKADRTPDVGSVVAAVRDQLTGTPFAGASIVPTSVMNGRGLPELRAALAAVLETTPAPADAGQPRLAVDRVFTLRGIGTVVTGTLTGGTLAHGQSVIIQPAGVPTRLRTLQSYGVNLEHAVPGQRTALALPDVAVAGPGRDGMRRGDVVTVPQLSRASLVMNVHLERPARLAVLGGAGAAPLRNGTRVRIHLGSSQHVARARLSERRPLEAGGTMNAELRFESLVFGLAGDRFIVRDWPGTRTLGAGVVLEVDADPRRFRRPLQGKFLDAIAAVMSHDTPASDRAQAAMAARLARDGWLGCNARLDLAGVPATSITAAVDSLIDSGHALRIGETLVLPAWWEPLVRRTVDGIAGWHRAHPEQAGWPLADLRASAPELAGIPDAGVEAGLLAELSRRACVVEGKTIRLKDHRPALPPALRAAGEHLRTTLASRPFEPPSRRELAPDTVSQQALRFLRDQGEVIEAGVDLVLAADAYARIQQAVRGHLKSHGSATVSDLRQLLNTSRRVIMPLVERLDRDGITVRRGDLRMPGPRA